MSFLMGNGDRQSGQLEAYETGPGIPQPRLRLIFNLALLVSLAMPLPSFACTLCHSPAAQEARLWIQHSFWPDLAAVLTCIPLMIAAALSISLVLAEMSE
jgi:hypothetical protein